MSARGRAREEIHHIRAAFDSLCYAAPEVRKARAAQLKNAIDCAVKWADSLEASDDSVEVTVGWTHPNGFNESFRTLIDDDGVDRLPELLVKGQRLRISKVKP